MRGIDRDPDLSAIGIDAHIQLGDGEWPDHDTGRLWPERILAASSPTYLTRRGLIGEASKLLRHDLIHYIDCYRLGWAEWLRASCVQVPAGAADGHPRQ